MGARPWTRTGGDDLGFLRAVDLSNPLCADHRKEPIEKPTPPPTRPTPDARVAQHRCADRRPARPQSAAPSYHSLRASGKDFVELAGSHNRRVRHGLRSLASVIVPLDTLTMAVDEEAASDYEPARVRERHYADSRELNRALLVNAAARCAVGLDPRALDFAAE